MVEAGKEDGICEEKKGNDVEVSINEISKVDETMIDVGIDEVSRKVLPLALNSSPLHPC